MGDMSAHLSAMNKPSKSSIGLVPTQVIGNLFSGLQSNPAAHIYLYSKLRRI